MVSSEAVAKQDRVSFPRCLQGRGVDWALKVLLLFFVGGAASCEKLLRCQKVDAGRGIEHTRKMLQRFKHLSTLEICQRKEYGLIWAHWRQYVLEKPMLKGDEPLNEHSFRVALPHLRRQQ